MRIWHLLITQQNGGAVSNLYNTNCSGAPSAVRNPLFILVHLVFLYILIKVSSNWNTNYKIHKIIAGIDFIIVHGLYPPGLFCLTNIYYKRFMKRDFYINKGIVSFRTFIYILRFTLRVFLGNLWLRRKDVLLFIDVQYNKTRVHSKKGDNSGIYAQNAREMSQGTRVVLFLKF